MIHHDVPKCDELVDVSYTWGCMAYLPLKAALSPQVYRVFV